MQVSPVNGTAATKEVEVFFMPLTQKEDILSVAKKTKQLLREAQLTEILEKKKLVAVKQHFGERGNNGYLKPQIAKVVGDVIKAHGGMPILVETNTLYQGQRANSYDHLMLAHEHGFNIETVGMPVVILDGITGQNQHSVPIPGKHFRSVFVVPDLPFFQSIFVLTHVKGHMMSGMGGAIKNLAMGFSSRAGKLAQHADFKPVINQKKCIQCGLCGQFCPVAAPSLTGGEMQIDLGKCTGCGECFVACQSDAIGFDWAEADRKFQEKMAEHALGAVIGHPQKVVYLNYLMYITRQCDCWNAPNPPLFNDVGIFAGFDPVAVDRACYDVANATLGEDVFRSLWPALDPLIQLEHGEAIGLGTQKYKLVELK